jgi:hypothetical protein
MSDRPTLNYSQPPRAEKMLVDSKCVELAEHFCQDNPEHKPHVSQLAEAIQEAVESFLSSVDYESNWMDEE